MSCKYYRGKCLFLNGKEDNCKGCQIKRAYNKGVRDTKKDYERPQGEWITWEEAGNYIASPNRHECSCCHDSAQVLVNGIELLSDFCPNCGADMRVKGGTENDKK